LSRRSFKTDEKGTESAGGSGKDRVVEGGKGKGKRENLMNSEKTGWWEEKRLSFHFSLVNKQKAA